MKIKEFIDKMSLLQNSLLEFLEDEDEIEEKYSNLIQSFNNQKLSENQEELKLFFSILSNVSNNHHKTINFWSKIEQIVLFFKDDIPNYFNNMDLFDLFHDNKKLLLFLIEEKLLIISKSISSKIISYQSKTSKYSRYFLPEIKPFIKNKTIELPENFEEKRKIGENDSEICRIIREDVLDEFDGFVKRENLSLTSSINHSIYETNHFLLQRKEVSLIEYAAFFGSIQIFKYLISNRVPLNSDLWLFAVHSNRMEMIRILEEKKIKAPFSSFCLCLKESIKCFHNDVAFYIQNKYLRESKQNDDLENMQFLNFTFISPSCNDKKLLLKLVEHNLVGLMKIYWESCHFDLNEVECGDFLLIKAVQLNQLEMTRFLLTIPEFDVNKKLCNEVEDNLWRKEAALHFAIENENKEIVSLLLNHKDIDVNIKSIESNDKKDIEKEKAGAIKVENVSLIRKKDISKYWNEGVEITIKRKEMTPLCIAIRKNNIHIVKLLLEHPDVDVNECSYFYDYYNFKSIHDGDEESILTKSKSSKTALDTAIKVKSIDIVRFLLTNQSLDVNNESRKQIYIQYYYKKENQSDYDVLNSIGTSKRTSLIYAIMKENLPIIRLFLDHPNIDVNYPSHIHDTDPLIDTISDNFGYKETANDYSEKLIKTYDQRPLILALEKGNEKIIELLLNNPHVDSDINNYLPVVLEKDNVNAVKFLLGKKMIGVNDEVIENETIFHYAVQEGEKEIVKYIINNHDIDINRKNSHDETPLITAIKNNRVDIIKLLLNHPKIDVNIHKNSKSPLYLAIKLQKNEIVFLLLKNLEIDVNRQTNTGESPLYEAINNENIEVVNALLKNPEIDVNIQTNSGESPLHIAVKKENDEIVSLLLKNPEINVNIKLSTGEVPLYFAFARKNDDIIDLLLKRPEIDPNIVLEDGYTPLNRSIEDEHIGRVKILLNNENTDVNMMGADGQLPIKIAISVENTIIFELLMKKPEIQFDIYSILGEDIPTYRAKMLFIAFKEKYKNISELLGN